MSEGSTTMVATKTTTMITPEELLAHLDDILERARVNGERFEIVENGKPIAILEPPNPPAISISDLIAMVGNLEMPGDGFADDLEAAQASRRPPTPPEWPDESARFS